MTSETFWKWFQKFEESTRVLKDGQVENRLLIFDGHLSHIWWETIEFAREKKVTILKLPAHTTELTQPLDAAVFKSLKDNWAEALLNRMQGNLRALTKKEFAEILCSLEVWKTSFIKNTIKNGFLKTGVYPVDRTMYPQHRFSPPSLEWYNKWVKSGRPNLTLGKIESAVPNTIKTVTSV